MSDTSVALNRGKEQSDGEDEKVMCFVVTIASMERWRAVSSVQAGFTFAA